MQNIKQLIGTNKPWGFLPLYLCLLTLSLLVSSNIINVFLLGNDSFVSNTDTFFIDFPYFKLGFHDIWYPIFATTVAYLISKINRINPLLFFLLYISIDFAHNCLYFYITQNKIYDELWFTAYYNACRFGLLFVFAALFTQKLKYYIFIIPIAHILSDQIAFWSEFLAEIYVFEIYAVKWNPIRQIISDIVSAKLLEGFAMAIAYSLTKRIMGNHNTLKQDTIDEKV